MARAFARGMGGPFIPEGLSVFGQVVTSSASYQVVIGSGSITFQTMGLSITNEGPGIAQFSFDGVTAHGRLPAGATLTLPKMEVPAVMARSVNGQEITVSATVWR